MIAFNRATATLGYLVAVLLLGGASAAGFSANLLLQVLGAALIGWSLWPAEDGTPLHTGLRRFGLALAVLVAVQFVPLPPGLWQHLPGREAVYRGYELLGVDAPWLTLSLSPWKSIASFAWWIPALALFLSYRASGAPTNRQTVLTLGAVGAASVMLGLAQSVQGFGYFYLNTNLGQGTGFFANSNHQGSFLLCVLALWGAAQIGESGVQLPTQGRKRQSFLVSSAVAIALLFGVLVSGSLACLALLIPVLASLVLVARPQWRISLPLALGAIALFVAGFAFFLLYGPAANDLTVKGPIAGISRQEFLATGSRIAADFAPFGSGTGSFVELYRWYENPNEVGTTFVNHAHNDLLELLIETGIFGLAALGVFLTWFVPRAWRLWSGERSHYVALAASVVIGVELVHSLVDYPLRTAAMSALTAIACVLLVRDPDPPRGRGRARASQAAAPDAPREMIRI